VTEHPLWHCPKCGARLVSRNLWHSCGRFTLEALFSGSARELLAAACKYVALLESLGDVQLLPQKTRLVAVARVRFAGLYPRKDHFIAGFALHRWLENPRIVKTVDYGPRWRGHYVRITSAVDLDGGCAPGCRNRTTSLACRATWRSAASVRRRAVGNDKGSDIGSQPAGSRLPTPD
jgi:hypothetical protein